MVPSLNNIDFNLLLPLHALLVEQNVTRAAERVQVGQPAMSAALARLRRLFDDPLLVKNGRSMVLGSGSTIDPASNRRVFVVTCSDYISTVLLRPVLSEVVKEAPHVRIAITSLHTEFIDHLRQQRCDLLIWPPGVTVEEEGFARVDLFTDTFIGLVDENNREVGEELDEEALRVLPYVMISGPRLTLADSRLSEVGVHRNVVATTETFTGATHLVPGTRMVTIVPRHLADQLAHRLGLRSVALKVSMPVLRESMYWHPRSTRDPAHRWLRERVREVAAQL